MIFVQFEQEASFLLVLDIFLMIKNKIEYIVGAVVLHIFSDGENLNNIVESMIKLVNMLPVIKDILTKTTLIEIIVELLCFQHENNEETGSNEEFIYNNIKELLNMNTAEMYYLYIHFFFLWVVADWGWKTPNSTKYLIEQKIITKQEGEILERLGKLLTSDIELNSEEIRKL